MRFLSPVVGVRKLMRLPCPVVAPFRARGFVAKQNSPYQLHHIVPVAVDHSESGKGSKAMAGSHAERGSMLLEQVIALAIVGIIMPALLAGLAVIINGARTYGDRGTILQLAQTQMESVQQQSFQVSPANYALISPIPPGYGITVTVAPSQQYTYTNGLPAPEIVQAITVTVTGMQGNLVLQGSKVAP